ncbi:MAG: phosphoglycerate mutase family protein [bacterium]
MFVRHAESVGNIVSQEERAEWPIPNHEYGITDRGKQQSLITGNYLGDKFGRNFFDIAFYSYFRRTRETFNGVRPGITWTGIKEVQDSRLNEKWDGIFHDLSKSEITKRYPDQILLRKRAGYHMYRAPGGENVPDAEMRIISFLAEYMNMMIEKNVLVVGHGRWFQIFRKVFHGWSVEKFLEIKKTEEPKNCSVSMYDKYALIQRTLGTHVVPWEGKITEMKTELA